MPEPAGRVPSASELRELTELREDREDDWEPYNPELWDQ
jgi:hypothetical protein